MHSHWLYITSFLDQFATSLLVPFLAVHLHSLGFSRLVVGVVTSIYPSMQLLSSPAAGYCSDRCGYKQTLILSLLFCSCAYYLLSSTSSLPVIFFCRVALGVLKHTQTLCKTIFVQLSRHEKLSAAFGFINAAEALGFMLGPTMGAYIIGKQNGFQYLCKITSTLFVINAVIVYSFLYEEKTKSLKTHTSTKNYNKILRIFQEFTCLDWNVFWDIFLLKWFMCVSLSLLYTNYALIIVDVFGASPSMVGYTNSFQGLISVITGLISIKITPFYNTNECHYVKLLHCFLILSFSLLCTSFVSDLFTFSVCLIPLSSSSTLLRIYTTEILLSKSSFENRGSVMGVENTIASSAFLLSPFICEICTSSFGSSSILFVAFLFTATGACLSGVLNWLHKTNYINKSD